MLKIVFYTEFSLEFGGGGTFISLWVFIPQILAGYKKNLAISPADNFQLYGLKPARGPGVGGGSPNAPHHRLHPIAVAHHSHHSSLHRHVEKHNSR